MIFNETFSFSVADVSRLDDIAILDTIYVHPSEAMDMNYTTKPILVNNDEQAIFAFQEDSLVIVQLSSDRLVQINQVV